MFETLVATGVLITALAGVAQILVFSAHWSRTAAGVNGALLAAQQKLEELRAADFTVGPAGEAITNRSLDISPASSLEEDVDPFVDWLDAAGQVLADPHSAVLTRRWRVAGFGAGAADTILIEVCVARTDGSQNEACLSTIRTRQS